MEDPSAPSVPVRKSGQKWTMQHLPPACHYESRWRRIFIPTYISFIAQQQDTWTVDDSVAISAMRKIWKVVYGNTISCKIAIDGPVFAIVSSTLSSQMLLLNCTAVSATDLRFVALCPWLNRTCSRQRLLRSQ
jgi:hypothetical protein